MSNTNCIEFERRLQAAVEERRPVDPVAFAEAAAHCSECRRAWDDYCLLERAIAQWGPRLPRVDLADAVLARLAFEHASADMAALPSCAAAPRRAVSGETSTRHARSRHGGWAVAASAAALVAALAPFAVWTTGTGDRLPDGSETVARMGAPTVPPHGDNAPDGEWRSLLRDAGTAYLGLAGDATSDMVAAVDLFVPARSAPPHEERPAMMPDGSWVEDVGQELSPIGRDVEQAVEFLFDSVSLDSMETI